MGQDATVNLGPVRKGKLTGQQNPAPPQQHQPPPALPAHVPVFLPGKASTPNSAYPGNALYEPAIRAYLPQSHHPLLDSAGPQRRVLLWIWGDHRRVDPVWRRQRLIQTFNARASGNPMLVPMPLTTDNVSNSLGTVHGSPPLIFITSPLSTQDYNSLLSLPCYNAPTCTTLVSPAHIPRMMRPLQLRGIMEVEYSDENGMLIVGVIRETLGSDPRAWQAMDLFHDAVSPPHWQYDRSAALDTTLNSIRLIARALPDDAGTEWSLEWDCPTTSWQGEEHWVNILRTTTFATAFGSVNITQAPIVWCNLCHSMDHTHRVCPYPDAPGWIVPPQPPTAPGSNGSGHGRGRGGGGGGGRGGGRGFGGGRGGRGRGSGRGGH